MQWFSRFFASSAASALMLTAVVLGSSTQTEVPQTIAGDLAYASDLDFVDSRCGGHTPPTSCE